MSPSVEMPALGESVTEGTLTRWLKSVGDQVEADEPLLEVSTDKVDTEVPSPVSGTLQKIYVEEDETVEIGAKLCDIGDGPAQGGDDAQDEPQQQAAPKDEPAPTPKQEAPAEQPTAGGGGGGGGGGTEVTMPALGESVTEGTVTRWLKGVGDSVDVDEPLLEVSTDKVDTEIPSPVAGIVQKVLVDEDETAEVGAVLALVGDGAGQGSGSGEPEQATPQQEAPTPEAATPEAAEQHEPEQEKPQQQAAPDEPKQEEAKAGSSAGVASPDAAGYVTPLVRKLARERKVDLASLKGTGIGGRIRKEDVLAAAGTPEPSSPASAAAAPSPAASAAPKQPADQPPAVSSQRGTTEKLTRLRKVIAQRMMESLQTSAQLTTVVEVDVTRIAQLRLKAKDGFKAREGVGLSFLPFVCVAAIEGLKAYPKVNSRLDGDSLVFPDNEHLALAVETDRGLLTPVIHNAGDLNLAALARKIADVALRTRTNKVTPDELAGGTFTITNTGSRGALFDTPIINQPQMAILGCGTVVKRPAVVQDADGNDTIAIRSTMYLSLSYDHRVVDGADAARYLSMVKARLEGGAFEAELGL